MCLRSINENFQLYSSTKGFSRHLLADDCTMVAEAQMAIVTPRSCQVPLEINSLQQASLTRSVKGSFFPLNVLLNVLRFEMRVGFFNLVVNSGYSVHEEAFALDLSLSKVTMGSFPSF